MIWKKNFILKVYDGEFLENFKRPSTPLFIFRKLCCKFFMTDMVACKEVCWPDGMTCMHMISRYRDHAEGWGSTGAWNLSENSFDLVAWPVL